MNWELKFALMKDGRAAFVIATKAGISPSGLSRIVRGYRAAYQLLEWCLEDGHWWREIDTLEHFAEKFDDLDQLRRDGRGDSLEVA